MSITVTYEGDRELAMLDWEFAIQSSNITHALKKQLGIPSMTNTFNSPNGAQVYVVDCEYVRSAHIVPQEYPVRLTEKKEYEDLLESLAGVADFVSGVVVDHDIEDIPISLPGDDPDKPVPLRPAVKELKQTALSASRHPHELARHKVAVRPGASGPAPVRPGAQTNTVCPGMYTGAMREVVQLMLGTGRIQAQTWEQRWLLTQDGAGSVTFAEGEQVESAFGLYENPQDPVVMVVPFDYRWGRTHGISFGVDGAAYIVQISAAGVYVMPLDLDPVSVSAEGRERYLQTCPELVGFFDTFGGFPTGRSINNLGDIGALVRSGEVAHAVSAEGMAEFYGNGALGFSSAHGWAFSPDGREAHNVVLRHRKGPRGASVSSHYFVKIDISAKEVREKSPLADALYGSVAEFAPADLSFLWERKAARMDHSEVERLLEIENIEQRSAEFDAAVVTPDFSVDSEIRLQREGPLPPGRQSLDFKHRQFKLWEPLYADLLDMQLPGIPGVLVENEEAPVFVCFEGSELRIVFCTYLLQPYIDEQSPVHHGPNQQTLDMTWNGWGGGMEIGRRGPGVFKFSKRLVRTDAVIAYTNTFDTSEYATYKHTRNETMSVSKEGNFFKPSVEGETSSTMPGQAVFVQAYRDRSAYFFAVSYSSSGSSEYFSKNAYKNSPPIVNTNVVMPEPRDVLMTCPLYDDSQLGTLGLSMPKPFYRASYFSKKTNSAVMLFGDFPGSGNTIFTENATYAPTMTQPWLSPVSVSYFGKRVYSYQLQATHPLEGFRGEVVHVDVPEEIRYDNPVSATFVGYIE